MAKKYIITILLLIFYKICFCQLETSVWYFGNYAGLDFKSKNPTILTDGKLKNFEGVATFSDSLGNLLFYTDGQTIWNKKHQIMDNGTDLIGDTSSTEAAIIVPWPKNDKKYFLFVVDAQGKEGGLSYSILDMSANDGLGKVTNEKSIKIEDCVCEKITAIRHANNQDFWVLSRLGYGNGIVEYKITSSGLDLSSRKVYNVSSLNMNLLEFEHADIRTLGYMRVSPNGKKIACANGGSWPDSDGKTEINNLEVFNFEPSTGEITFDFCHKDYLVNLYGVEFSNDCSKLYYTSCYDLFQLDLTAGDAEDIKNSLVKIGEISHPTIFEKAGALQLAINGKIYVAQDKNEYLGVINNPREKGEACNFDNQGQYLGGKLSRMGLPNFIPSYFLPPNFTIENNCINQDVKFICTDNQNIDKYLWEISTYNGEKITQNSQRQFSYNFSKSGIFKVTLTINSGANESSQYRFFQVFDKPEVNLNNDTIICQGDTAIIKANIPENTSFIWSNNSNDTIINITKNETIGLTITNLFTGCYNYATKKITVIEPTQFSLGKDTIFCFGDTIKLQNKLDFNYKKFTWLDNNKSALNREIKEPGSYIAQLIDNNNCYFYDTINIERLALPKIDFKTDDIFCKDSIKILDCNVKNAQYLWSTNDTTQTIIVNKSDVYSVIVTDKYGCQSKDTITLKEYQKSEYKLPADTLHCDDQPLILHAEWPDATDYIWQDYSHNQDFEVKNSGTFIIDVVNICGSSIDSINVTLKYCGEFIFPNIITPNNDGINDYFKIKGLEWTSGWQINIYNREGKIIYHSNDYKNDWNAEGINDGVYFYILSKNGQKYTGNVSVYRI